jgi:hypothetical protein
MLNGLALRKGFEAAPKVRKNPQIADGRLRVFKYLSRFKTNIIAF